MSKRWKAAAVICEYNPFHRGHQYHLEETRRISGAEYVIAVMSGNFVQRGEPAIADKWLRTEMALRGGADLVVELPAAYALSSAQYFAGGAVDLICKMSVVTHLSFGSEAFGGEDGAAELERFAHRTPHGPELDRGSLRGGRSYAAAARRPGAAAPNDVLGAEYIRALRRQASAIRPITIARKDSGHDGPGSAGEIRSLIRSAPSAAEQAPWKALMPETAANLLEKEIETGKSPVLSEHFDQSVLAVLRFLGAEGLRSCPFVAEGLEYKIYSAACSATSFEMLIRMCTSLRYTASRIRRIVFAAILGITREMIKMPAPYIRILGMNRGCGPLMDALTERACVPVITSKAKFLKSAADLPETAPAKLFLRTENRAAELYALGYPARDQRIGYSELTHPLIYVSVP